SQPCPCSRRARGGPSPSARDPPPTRHAPSRQPSSSSPPTRRAQQTAFPPSTARARSCALPTPHRGLQNRLEQIRFRDRPFDGDPVVYDRPGNPPDGIPRHELGI